MSRPALAKDVIASTLVQLLAEKGPEADIPVKELISRSGVSRSTYYYYFRKVDDVAEYVMDQFVEEYERVLGNYGNVKFDDEYGALIEGTEQIANFVYQHRDAFTALLGGTHRDLFRYHLVRATRKNFECYEWFYAGEGNAPMRLSHLEKQYYSYYSGYSFYSFMECWAKRGFQESPAEFVRLNTRLMLMEFVSIERGSR